MSETLLGWRDTFLALEPPVLARTTSEIALLAGDPDSVSAQKLNDIVTRDPLMTLKVMRYVEQHRGRTRTTAITTIGHALMMMGVHPFFAQFSGQQTLESQLASDNAALRGVLGVIARNRHAALSGHDWAKFRHDLDPSEILTAILLHDIAEILLWSAAPVVMREIADRVQADAALRVEDAELAVLGFRVAELNLALLRAWKFPEEVLALLDYQETKNPRILNVAYAVAFARNTARGWKQIALFHDYYVIGKLLGMALHAIERRAIEVAQQAVRDAAYYGVRMNPPQPLFPREPF